MDRHPRRPEWPRVRLERQPAPRLHCLIREHAQRTQREPRVERVDEPRLRRRRRRQVVLRVRAARRAAAEQARGRAGRRQDRLPADVPPVPPVAASQPRVREGPAGAQGGTVGGRRRPRGPRMGRRLPLLLVLPLRLPRV